MKIAATKLISFIFSMLIFTIPTIAQNGERIEELLKKMTLEEKIGQMNQYTSDWITTGPITKDGDKQSKIRQGMVGSMLNVKGVAHTRALQEMALQSRLGIPLLFALDVIHGYRTIFPIPLAEAASWDLEYIKRSAQIAAQEASAAGIHWTFAPMVDIARDARWGRIMEGAGEDTYLGSLIAEARVKGFQGNLGEKGTLMACAKHFAAYGAAEGGRDYNTVDMSYRRLYETYLPPFKAAVDAGVATFMNSFNDINGIPATGDSYIQREILKGRWNFGGFMVSDWGSIGEMIAHGYAKDGKNAAMLAANAGSDMDMESRCYINHLKELVEEGKVKMEVIDDAVRRVLRKKFEMGLFDDPFKYCDTIAEKKQWNNPQNLLFAREMAKRSIVLLKNSHQTLPLSSGSRAKIAPQQKIALIGPLAKAVRDNLGAWSFSWEDDTTRIVTIYQGIKTKVGEENLIYAKGCEITGEDRSGFKEAIRAAKKADVIIVAVGESGGMSGEAKSRSDITLPGVQEELVIELIKTGKPVIVLISAGRPLVFNRIADKANSILYTWWLGTEAGNAIADVLFGQYNPSAKLPVTFPQNVGQIPIYYNHLNTGRPVRDQNDYVYKSAYTDITTYPKYPFGYGLSYTTFQYGPSILKTHSNNANSGNANTINTNTSNTHYAAQLFGCDTLYITTNITNTGKYPGEEIVQLYIRDITASVSRPVKELKGFQKIYLNAGETKEVQFKITPEHLRFYDATLNYIWEEGEFDLMVGTSSEEVQSTRIYWHKPKTEWRLVWSDEFDYTGLPDSKKWNFDTAGNSWAWGNNEAQFYTSCDSTNAWVDNGILTITAHSIKTQNHKNQQIHKVDTGGKSYTSARLTTKGKGDWLYGRFEIKARVPQGVGTWPAIWMLPTENKYGGWPKSGEIDIMENVGYDPEVIWGSAHTEAYNHVINTHKNGSIKLEGAHQNFHKYTLEWYPNRYEIYVDNTLIFTFKNENHQANSTTLITQTDIGNNSINRTTVWPFDHPFYLIINLAIGGNWGGQKGIDNNSFPHKLEIDYVRIFQK